MSKLIMNRRGLLRTMGAGAAATLASPMFFTRGAWANNYCNDPTASGKIVFGFNVPQTGTYAEEGLEQLKGYQLAVKHINGEGDGGLLKTFKPLALEGNGVLGRKVEFVTGDTQTNTDAARDGARRMIERDGAIMVTGCVTTGEAVAQQALCHELGVIYMSGLTHGNDTTGKDKRRYGFRHFFNAHQSGVAIAPILGQEYGNDRRAYHLTADYNWGWTQEESIKAATEALGWETVATVRTPLGLGDYSQYLTPVLNSGADVLILNHYGHDMVNSLPQAVQFGLRERQANGKQFEIIVPMFSELMAVGAGDAVKGIIGTQNWNWQLEDEGSKAFTQSYGAEYGEPPSQSAHTGYVQAILYADAVQRAGSFYPPEVIKALEEFEFDGMGNGPTLYRGDDHQCIKEVLVVRGNENPTSRFDVLNVVGKTPRDEVTYDPAIFGGELGPYEPNQC
ncbi:substrate-binding protein [Paracoccus alkenifer]|uniref:Amino acid/amide ABC transporter substrate-binding protein, HAAT family (TC 3.A.1.4.-) n=1 Tax=Paracoccus alkenifer TaxID=65735 RepID=A0A1H6JZI2_9RHOB|nr:substrate-binding protein [Paracoccus alkenifer]SEH68248.1 amino acid/amide ABC transporter substrate-binding protein, HAAT family (TC 3.A.1.4.-) [Paracoccus alkenifer]